MFTEVVSFLGGTQRFGPTFTGTPPPYTLWISGINYCKQAISSFWYIPVDIYHLGISTGFRLAVQVRPKGCSGTTLEAV